MAKSRSESQIGNNGARAVTNGREGRSTAVVVVGRPPALILWTSTFLFLGFLAVLLVGIWIARFGVGLTWASPHPALRGQMFNYHPLFMTLGLLYLHGIANITYRLFQSGNYLALRIAHGTLQVGAIVFVGLALYAVYCFKEMSPRTRNAHFRSTHSWLGLTLLVIIGLQFLCGFFGLLCPGFRGRYLTAYRAVHRFTGKFIFLLACGTALVGIDQVVPKTPIMNTLALVVILYAVNGYHILTKKEYDRTSQVEVVEASSEENITLLRTGQTQYS